MENSIAVQLHQKAMDLYDFGKIFKAKGYPEYYYEGNLELAFLLDKEAALRIQVESDEQTRQCVYPRSAGWLAFKSGKYLEAKQLALLGLSHNKIISGYEQQKLLDLLAATEKKLKESAFVEEEVTPLLSLIAVVASANIDERNLQIRKIGDKDYQIVKIATEDFINIARLFLGETVEIKVQKTESGEMVLKDIKRAA